MLLVGLGRRYQLASWCSSTLLTKPYDKARLSIKFCKTPSDGDTKVAGFGPTLFYGSLTPIYGSLHFFSGLLFRIKFAKTSPYAVNPAKKVVKPRKCPKTCKD